LYCVDGDEQYWQDTGFLSFEPCKKLSAEEMHSQTTVPGPSGGSIESLDEKCSDGDHHLQDDGSSVIPDPTSEPWSVTVESSTSKPPPEGGTHTAIEAFNESIYWTDSAIASLGDYYWIM